MRFSLICVEVGTLPSGRRGRSTVSDVFLMSSDGHQFISSLFCNFLKKNDVGQLKTIREFLAVALINLWDEKTMSCQDGSQREHC